MADQSLFNEQTEHQIDPSKDYLPELVGDDKKYKTPADLARSVLFKETHISRLERENKELREDLTKRLNMEELVDKLKDAQKAPVPSTLPTPGEEQNNKGEPNDEQLKLSIDERIKNILTQERLQESKTRNLNLVKEALQSTLGDDFVSHVKAKARELETSEEDLNNLAMSKPQVFLKLMDLPKAQANQQTQLSIFSPGKTQMNTTPQQTRNLQGHKTFQQWQEIRKSDPKEYTRLYSQMHKDALALGEAFYT